MGNDLNPSRPLRAIVRNPSRRIAEGEVTHIERVPVDPETARVQHREYLSVLERLGLTLIFAPEAEEYPDGLFVEDTLVMVGGHAIVTRPGAASRRGETTTITDVVRALGVPMSTITRGTVDGGDVLVVRDHVFIGLTTRTTQEAIEQFADIVRPLSFTTVAVEVPGCLHLKSAITSLPDGTLIGVDGWYDPAPFASAGFTVHPADEPSGGDVLWLDDTVVLPSDAPDTGRRITAMGFAVVHVDVSELQKIEAGVTCMSVLL